MVKQALAERQTGLDLGQRQRKTYSLTGLDQLRNTAALPTPLPLPLASNFTIPNLAPKPRQNVRIDLIGLV